MTEPERFARCLAEVLKKEGGYVDDPRDAGGATNLGITIGTLSHWLGHPASKDDVRALTPASVAPIYHANFWRASSADLCTAGLDLMVFDCAVNMGVGRAVTLLQEAIGAPADGHFGPQSQAALQAARVHATIGAMSTLREAKYREFAAFPTFGRGWLNRLAEVTSLALEWANNP